MPVPLVPYCGPMGGAGSYERGTPVGAVRVLKFEKTPLTFL